MAFPSGCGAPALFLAPMQDVTDADFMRIVSAKGAPDFCCCEYFRIHECFDFEKSVLRALLNPPQNTRTVAQFIGEDVACIIQAIERLKEFPSVDMLDLNLGCPAPKIYKKNVGGGLLRSPKKIDEILTAMRERWKGTFSVKMRLGFDSSENFEDLFKLVISHSPDFVSVHARTVRQLYRGSPDYDAITRAVELAGDIPVVANGDILSVERALEVVKKTSCAGLMVGRHAIRNPWIFRQMREAFAGSKIFRPTLADVRAYVDELASKTIKEGERLYHADSRLKKFLNFVGTGVDEKGEFLFKMRRACGMDELLKVCDEFMLGDSNSEKLFAFEPYGNLCARPNCEDIVGH